MLKFIQEHIVASVMCGLGCILIIIGTLIAIFSSIKSQTTITISRVYWERSIEVEHNRRVLRHVGKIHYWDNVWTTIRTIDTSGEKDQKPYWGDIAIGDGERLGNYEEEFFVCGQTTDNGKYVEFAIDRSIWTSIDIGDTITITTIGLSKSVDNVIINRKDGLIGYDME